MTNLSLKIAYIGGGSRFAPRRAGPLVARHSANQELIITAALTGDKDLAFQALYNDPANSLTIDQTWEMFNALLQASGAFSPFAAGSH